MVWLYVIAVINSMNSALTKLILVSMTIVVKIKKMTNKGHLALLVSLVIINVNNFANVVSANETDPDISPGAGDQHNELTVIPKCCEFGFTFQVPQNEMPDPDKTRIKCVEIGSAENTSAWTIPATLSSSFSSINVTFKVHRPQCHGVGDQAEFGFHWVQVNENEESLNYEDELRFQDIFTPEGYFAPAMENPIYYPPELYCMERVNSTSILIELCESPRKKTTEDLKPGCGRSGTTTACLRKCCPMGQMVTKERNDCVPTAQTWLPKPVTDENNKHGGPVSLSPVTTQTGSNEIIKDTTAWLPIVALQSPASFCVGENEPPISWTSDDPDQEFKLTGNGDVLFKLPTSDSWKNVLEESEFYCLDQLDTSIPDSYQFEDSELDVNDSRIKKDLSNISYYRNENDSSAGSRVQILVFCGKSQDAQSLLFSSIYGGVMLGSSLFLLIAATINFLLWKKQNVHNWTVQAYIISLFFMYVFLGLSHIVSQHYKTDDSTTGLSMEMCAFIGGGAHYFFLSTFCWLFMINFDLWWKFRKLTATSVQSQRARKQRLCLYVLFSTGAPLIIVTVGLCIQRFVNTGMDPKDWLVAPNYGASVCYMEESAGWAYLYGPISVLLIFNLSFFISTIYSLYQIRKMTKIATEGNHKNKDHKYFRVKLFGKLFCIMGILWNFEVISFAVDSSKEKKSWSDWYWVITDILNIVQAVVIFYIFTCKRHVKNSLETQYPAFKTFFGLIRHAGELLRMKAPKSRDPPTDSETAVASNSNTSNNDKKRSSLSSNTYVT